jgi:threonine aldolase
MGVVDLRSDTVTRPTPAMREAMAGAEVGDDVFGDDPTVRELEARTAGMFGLEAGLFFPTGTQSNLAALMAHCGRGEEVIVGQDAHTYRYEGGGAAVLGSIQPQPLQNLPDGTLDLAMVEAAIKPDDPHFAITRLLALENTIGGKVIGRDYLAKAVTLAWKRGLSTHLDGARIFNASVKLGMPVNALCAGFDTVSVCLSKGLGAPAGTVLVGHQGLIDKARRIRKMLGGGMRQVGILAAAGLHALEHHVARLAEDHASADRLAGGLAQAGYDAEPPQTNMVFVKVAKERCAGLQAHLAANGVVAIVAPRTRLVTHLDVDAAGVDRAVAAFASFSCLATAAK